MRQSAYQLFYKLLIAFAIAFTFKLLFAPLHDLISFDLILITVVIVIIWEGNKKIDGWLNTKYSWIKSPKKRLIAQAIAFTLFTTITLFLLMFILHQIKFGDGRFIDRRMQEIFLPALFFALALIAIYISYNFLKALKNSLLEVEKYKTESANAQLQNLKSQINPHFLFNNLSVLTSLVYKNQDKAVEFINELSKVYRYVLDNKTAELVTLEEELNFLQHYIYLLTIRFDKSIQFTINVNDALLPLYLPPMCLQMLVENTIQHNEVSQANPLNVTIYTQGNALVIQNNCQPRSDDANSSKLGLKNIQSRYSFFTNQTVEIVATKSFFTVVLPLIAK
ncbi:MAG: histidine kinase [Flavobacterium sp.]|nr:histidine kinase [Flavobacterium sp.]